MSVSIRAIGEDDAPKLGAFDLIVDSLLETGAVGAPTGGTRALIESANAASVPILAVDIPSGVNADTGQTLGTAIRATKTVTFALPKVGLLMLPGALNAGEVSVADIGIPTSLLTQGNHTHERTTQDWMRTHLPKRQQARDANKGSFGKVLVIAGSAAMLGAAMLTATAALRTGAGYVTLALPERLLDRAMGLVAEIILRPLPETSEGTHGGRNAIEIAIDLGDRADAVAIGPGMGSNQNLTLFVQTTVARIRKPIVIDADAINALSGFPEQILGRNPLTTVLTPHPLELARLVEFLPDEVQNDRRAAAIRAAQRSGSAVLLKGARTLVALPDKQIAFNRMGTPVLATPGSGDVLTGIIVTLMAQGMNAYQAARAGAYLHALAGEIAEFEIGTVGVAASDIRDRIPAAFRRVNQVEALDEP